MKSKVWVCEPWIVPNSPIDPLLILNEDEQWDRVCGGGVDVEGVVKLIAESKNLNQWLWEVFLEPWTFHYQGSMSRQRS